MRIQTSTDRPATSHPTAASDLGLKCAERAHKLPARDGAVLVNVELVEDELGVREIEREAQRVERARELVHVQLARAVAVPFDKGLAHVELLLKDGLRDLEDGALHGGVGVVHLERLAIGR